MAYVGTLTGTLKEWSSLRHQPGATAVTHSGFCNKINSYTSLFYGAYRLIWHENARPRPVLAVNGGFGRFGTV